MKLAQSSAIYFNHSLQYAIKDLHALGYEGVEIWGGRPHMYRNDLDEEMQEIRSLLAELNMGVSNLIPAQFRYPSILCSANEQVRRDSVRYIFSAMDNALKVGAPSVSLCPGMAVFDGDLKLAWRQLLKSFSEIGEYNEDKQLDLLIEPAHRFESNLILTVEDCLRMIEQLKTEHFGVLVDLGHCHLNGEDIKTALRLCKGLPLHIHVDDNWGKADDHLVPGEGNIDFTYFAEALQELNYSGYLAVELGGKYNMEPSAACKQSLAFLRGVLN